MNTILPVRRSMREQCRLGFDADTKQRLRADYADRGRGPIRKENCQCGRLVVAESVGGKWMPRTHYPPSPYKSSKGNWL
jgi:hypothetical protein